LLFAPIACWRALFVVAIIVPVWFAVCAAELDGVQLPDTLQADGEMLQLNDFGLRTYSVLGIHIYVAALYLEHLSTDAEAIIRSPETKVLTVRFERNVSADAARNAWRVGLENNCQSPSHDSPHFELAYYYRRVGRDSPGRRLLFVTGDVAADRDPVGWLSLAMPVCGHLASDRITLKS
jgi:hypothetical protein